MKVRRTAVFLILMCISPGVFSAAREGRLIGKVLDPEGKPIADVTVIATSAEVDFREVDTTDYRGVFKFDFPERFVTYTLRFEKGGYDPFESEQEWQLEGTARQEFTMQTAQPMADVTVLPSTSKQAIAAFNAGVVAFNRKELGTAEGRFKEALGHDPELHHAWVALARVYVDEGRHQDAVEATEKAIALGSTDQTAWRMRWEAYRDLGEEEKAAEALLELENATVRAEEAKRIYNEGVALTKAGDGRAAYAKFRQALEVDPNLQEALVGVATSGVEIGRADEALAAAETILRTDPGNEQALRIRYNAALALGDSGKLVDALVSLAAIEPQVARDGLLKLAFEAYDDANDMPLARERFLLVVGVDPKQALSHYFIGLINANLGNNEEAIRYLTRFLELAPSHSEAGSARELIAYLKDSE